MTKGAEIAIGLGSIGAGLLVYNRSEKDTTKKDHLLSNKAIGVIMTFIGIALIYKSSK